jgi:hypothetical protein
MIDAIDRSSSGSWLGLLKGSSLDSEIKEV